MEISSVQTIKQRLDPSQKTVFISGVTGQDGSLLSDYLLRTTPYNIVGGARRLSVENHDNIRHLDGNTRFHLIGFDLTDSHSIAVMVKELQPDWFINLAAQSFVKISFDHPDQTLQVNVTGVVNCLEAIRQHRPFCRFYNAGSSEEFGNVAYSPQDENHPLCPRSPYAASKASARHWVKVYRDSYNLYAIQSWLFNHEGVRRGEEFVSRKITKGVVRIYGEIKRGLSSPIIPIELGNLDAKRDWSDAEDMVVAIWAMMNNDKPKEYVVSSGENHSIRDFVEVAFEGVGVKGTWVGKGLDEKFVTTLYIGQAPTILVRVNPAFYRPAEVDDLRGDSSKFRSEVGWKNLTDFDHLVAKMVYNDMKIAGLGNDFFNLHVKVGQYKKEKVRNGTMYPLNSKSPV